MKILFGLSSFFPENTAGTENYVFNLSKELINKGYDVSVVFPSVGKYIEKYIYEGIDVYTFVVPLKLSTKELNGLDKVSGLDEFSRILDEIKPDIFHLHSLSRSFHAEHIRIAKQKGIKTVFTAHLGGTFCVNGDVELFQKKQCNVIVKNHRCLSCFIKKQKKYNIFISSIIAFLINILLKTPLKYKFPAFNIVKNKTIQIQMLKKYSDTNIAIATWLKKAFEINHFKKIKIVNQGISKEFISKSISKIENDKIELIFIGRMHPDKGIHLLLDALVELNKTFNLTVITIPFIDEIKYYQKIKQKYIEIGFSSWYENLTPNQVSEILSSKDMLVLPSIKNEAAPLVILEAFAKKIPVLGSSYIAIKEMIFNNVNGLVFKNGDVKSLQNRLLFLRDRPEVIKELSKNIKEPRTFIDVANEMSIIYEEI